MVERISDSGIRYDSTPMLKVGPEAGEFPYRSGIHRGMYTERPWTIRQYAGFGNPAEANLRLKGLIESGVTGLSIAFDLPTQMGLDPDDELASAEVGKVGVSISSLQDMRKLFDGIDISKISTSMTINATAPILLLMYESLAEERGVELNSLRGTIQNDILKEFIARGTYIFSPKKSLEMATETIAHCCEFLPNWNFISISGYHMSEAGATAVQEIAFTFANAIEYMQMLIDNGKEIDDIAPRMSFFFSSRMTLLEEIAKFRAAREVWAQIMRSKFQTINPKSSQLRFHAQTAGVQLIAQNPELNIARATLQALGAILGGTQSLHVNAFDEAIALPSETSARIALQTQQIIMEETDLTLGIDPFRGSFLVENMTNQMIEEIEKEMSNITALGGALQGIHLGYQKDKIETNAYRIAQEIEDTSRKIIGLNFSKFDTSIFSEEDPLLKTSGHEIVDKFRLYKDSRNLTEVRLSLRSLSEVASANGKVLPQIKNCISAGATLGEICKELSSAWKDC